jgi:hypothetical protein
VENLNMPRFIALFLLVFSLGSVWGQQPQEGAAVAPRTRIDGERYWYNEGFGRLRNLTEEDGKVLGEFRSHHGFVPFWISKTERDDSQAKTRGYKQMVKDMIAWVKDSNKEAKEYATRRLGELTGESFESPNEWQQWYQRHANELVWSDEKHKFITEQKEK